MAGVDTIMKTRTKPLVANLYNPHEQSKEQLMKSFVVRHDVFQKLFQDIKSSDMTKPERHYLIEGQRGTGKTTLLLRLNYAIENDSHLQNWLIPIVLKEEAYYGIRHLFKLWKTVAQELEVKDNAFSGLVRQMSDSYNGSQTSSFGTTSYEQTCFEILINALKNRSKKIILFIDNLGEMLRNFSDQENLRFREVLTNSTYLRLIGATPVVFEALQKENLVFYHFFKTIQLEGLNKEETRNLLLELAKAYHEERIIQQIIRSHPGRIEALRILTGGVIRTLVLLFEIFTGSQNGNSMSDLDDILDRVTPLYQNRMKELTPLQRDVVNAVALNWDAITPEEIAHETCMSTDDILAILSELEKVLIIQQVISENHQQFYCLKERFFNIWYLMRLAPGGSRSKVLWLLHFLESWYNTDELIQQARKHTEAIAARRYTPNAAYFLTEAFAKTGQLDMDTEHQMIHETKKLLQKRDPELAEELPPSDKEIFNKAEACYRKKDYEKATRLLLTIKHKNGEIYFRLGDAFSKLASYKKAIHCFLKAIEKGHIEAMLHLGNVYYYELKNYKDAEKYYLLAVKDGEEQMHSKVSLFRNFLSKTFENRLGTAIKRKESPGAPKPSLNAVKKTTAEAMFQLGNLYTKELKDYESARIFYMMAVKADHVDAMGHLGLLYHYMLKDYEKAAKYYRMAVKRGAKNYAAVNLGGLYQDVLKDYQNAEKYYLLAAQKDDASAMNGLAWLYFEQKINKQEALDYARRSVEKEKNIYTAHTLACVDLWNDQPEHAVQSAQEFMYDEESYQHLEQDILFYLMLLLAKQQHYSLTKYFEVPELDLQERFKPLYYAFLYFTGNPGYHKLPPELSETVEDMIQKIKQLAVDYQ
jgi:TPR repeat protein